ncbi:BamA/TamA family outer membrane protein [Desulfatiferula olefinivorans]
MLAGYALLIWALMAMSVHGYVADLEGIESSVEMEPDQPSKRLLILPYPFYNSTIGTGVGLAGVAEGYGQDRMLTVGTGLVSAQGTYMLFMMVRNYRAPFCKRLIIDPQASVGRYENIQSYILNNPEFPQEDAGTNDSSKDNFIEADGDDMWFDVRLRYLLPIGHGEDPSLPRFKIINGICVSSDDDVGSWNPLKTGRTYLELTPFYRNQSLDNDEGDIIQKTAGTDVAIVYDNRDFNLNPSNGSSQRLYYSFDWGDFGSSRPWSVVGLEMDDYINLGPSETARQRVLTFSFWTTDCLSWNDSHTDNGTLVHHRPPSYKGANLGGLFRLRGYPATRFNDRSAIYYGSEYRHTLHWNPLENVTLGNRLDVDWFQVVAFAELGRVAHNWNFSELHSDMKETLGVGLRVMANNIVLRADLAASPEDVFVQLFIGHPF